jgi:hypothetical protein
MAHAQTVTFSGSAGIEQAYGFPPQAPSLARQELNLAGASTAGTCDIKLAARLRHQTRLDPAGETEAELRAANISCRWQDWLVSAGRQTVVWGKADGFPVLDVVHPFDYREFLLDEREASRRPLAMVRLEKQVDTENYAQWLAILEKRSDLLPGPSDRFGAPWRNQARLTEIASADDVRTGLSHPQTGFKWEHTSTGIGWTANVLNRWSPLPYFVSDATAGSVRAQEYRQSLAGGSFDLPLSEWVIRGEAIHVHKVYLSVSAVQIDFRPFKQNSWMLGIDRNVGDWLLGVQFFQTQFSSAGIVPLGGGRQNTMTFMATRSLWQDRVTVQGFLAHDPTHRGTWLRAKLSWRAKPSVELSLVCDRLTGTDDSSFGQLERASRIKFGAKTDF